MIIIIRKSLISFFTFLAPIKACLAVDLSNEGFLGTAFYGVNQDLTGSVVNQVGPYADFSIPKKLTARSNSDTLQTDEYSKLEASLLFDDGTVTLLDSSEVTWASDSSEVFFDNAFVYAKKISENLKISVTATAEGFNTVVFLRLETASSDAEHSALSNSTDLIQKGWRNSSWFGNFYDYGKNWIYHQYHGWLFAHSTAENSLWFWNPEMKWLWTAPAVYPHIYRENDANWLYFIVQGFPEKLYFNQNTRAVESLQN